MGIVYELGRATAADVRERIPEPPSYSAVRAMLRILEEKGHIRIGKGTMDAVAIVTDAVREGVLWTNALIPGSPANSLVHRVPDPITNRYRFKLGKGRVTKIGESPYKHSFTQMTFKSRAIV